MQFSIEILDKTEQGVNIAIDLINSDKIKIERKKSGLIKVKENSLTEKARELEASGLNTARTYRRPNLVNDIDRILLENPQLIRTLTEDEILEKRLDWARKSIKDIENVERRFYEKL